MELKIKSSLISIGIFILGIVITLPVTAADCPLDPQTAYRTKAEPAVYYVTRQCTKRVFLNEATYFAYFSSWKDVKITSAKTLISIPDDSRGPMRVKGEIFAPVLITTTTPKTSVQPVTPPVTPITTQPPSTPATPVIIEKPGLTGVMKTFLDCPTDAEQAIIEKDFTIIWNPTWDNTPFSCVYQTISPTRLPIYATLRLLKQIEFTKPLPFTNEQNLYSYLTAKKLTLIPNQSCAQYSTGGNYTINLGGIFAHTHGVRSGSATCELVGNGFGEGLDNFVYNPIYKAATLVHEAHHAINASAHDGVNGGDKDINGNSAWAAQFYFYAWVNLYSNNVDAATKILAKNAAIDILLNRFSVNKCPADQELKTVVNTIYPNLCT